jgi:hypothetical protein
VISCFEALIETDFDFDAYGLFILKLQLPILFLPHICMHALTSFLHFPSLLAPSHACSMQTPWCIAEESWHVKFFLSKREVRTDGV